MDLGIGRLRFGVDLSVLAYSGALASSNDRGDVIERVQGGLDLNIRTERVQGNIRGTIGWSQYAGVFSSGTLALSFLSASVAGNIDVSPGRPVGLEILETFQRNDAQVNPVFRFATLAMLDETRFRLRLAVPSTPLEVGLSALGRIGIFDSQQPNGSAVCANDPACDPAQAHRFNYGAYSGLLDVKWRLLPKTGLLLEANAGAHQYFWSGLGNAPAVPVSAIVGLGTLVADRLRFSIRAGYAGLFFRQSGINAVYTVIGAASVTYRVTEPLALTAGVRRQLEPTAGQNHFYVMNRGYFGLEATPVRTLTLHLQLAGELTGFGTTTSLNMVSGSAEAGADWTSADWLHVLASVIFSGRSSFSGAQGDPIAFRRVLGLVGVAALF